jgi:hypothetical protein
VDDCRFQHPSSASGPGHPSLILWRSVESGQRAVSVLFGSSVPDKATKHPSRVLSLGLSDCYLCGVLVRVSSLYDIIGTQIIENKSVNLSDVFDCLESKTLGEACQSQTLSARACFYQMRIIPPRDSGNPRIQEIPSGRCCLSSRRPDSQQGHLELDRVKRHGSVRKVSRRLVSAVLLDLFASACRSCRFALIICKDTTRYLVEICRKWMTSMVMTPYL